MMLSRGVGIRHYLQIRTVSTTNHIKSGKDVPIGIRTGSLSNRSALCPSGVTGIMKNPRSTTERQKVLSKVNIKAATWEIKNIQETDFIFSVDRVVTAASRYDTRGGCSTQLKSMDFQNNSTYIKNFYANNSCNKNENIQNEKVLRQMTQQTTFSTNPVSLCSSLSSFPQNILRFSQMPLTSSTVLKQHRLLSSLPLRKHRHPLAALSAEEITATSSAIRRYYEEHVLKSYKNSVPDMEWSNKKNSLRFVAITLKEPPKDDLLAYNHHHNLCKSDLKQNIDVLPLQRYAEAITIDTSTGLATEWVVHLGDMDERLVDTPASAPNVVGTRTLPAGTQPMLTPDDCELAENIVQTSPEVARIINERYGITDMKLVACDPWSIHLACEGDVALTNWNATKNKPGRLVQTFLYYRLPTIGTNDNALDCNHYAHPIDIVPVVDLNERCVVTIQGVDRIPVPKIPTTPVNYHRNLLHTNTYLENTWRSDYTKPLNVLQPDGPSFVVGTESDGDINDVSGDPNVVSWQKWKIRVGFNYREGIVLHDVSYDGRPVLHRASLVEMAVPYGDIHAPFQRKCAFDVGDYGLGYCANSLELGCDCLGHIHYFDAILSNADGEPVLKKKVICMHEEDDGILWKHVEYRNNHNESRRSRELIISSIATVVNYEYLFYWKFKQDGMIEFEIKLSGELSTNSLSADEYDQGADGDDEEIHAGKPKYGVLVAPGVNAQIHQHMFCVRLDMAVDGRKNTVSEVDVIRQPVNPTTNPYGNAFQTVETIFDKEQDAIRTADPSKARYWKISNATGRVNQINHKPTAFKLIPFTKGPAHPVLLLDEASEVAKKGQFATANLWVTKHSDTERFPAGEHTPQGNGSVGLSQWIQANRTIRSEDIVLWHAFGVCHIPRVEDFPVMPCESTGFTLKPDNFFNGNPAIDLPPETNKASKLANEECCNRS